MAGTGGIGGGSVKLYFKVKGKPAKKDVDNSIGSGQPTEVKLVFPGGGTKRVILRGNQRIRYSWGPARLRRRRKRGR